MGAKVFISWSGELSKDIGEAIRDWLPKVLQSVKPYFTPDDIEKGARWSDEIANELSSSQLGIICLTLENQNSPWILFEAGALSKNIEESKVYPILFNFDTTDLSGPLASFQATKFNKEDIKMLLESINNSCNETKIEQKNLDETFEMWWPKLEEKIKDILTKEKTSTKPKKRTDRELLEEILDLTRSNSKSIFPEQRRVSRITLENLVMIYRRRREKYMQGNSLGQDLEQMRYTIERLCKECNLDNIMRHMDLSTNNTWSDIRREKNSGRESDFFVKKSRLNDDTNTH